LTCPKWLLPVFVVAGGGGGGGGKQHSVEHNKLYLRNNNEPQLTLGRGRHEHGLRHQHGTHRHAHHHRRHGRARRHGLLRHGRRRCGRGYGRRGHHHRLHHRFNRLRDEALLLVDLGNLVAQAATRAQCIFRRLTLMVLDPNFF
jgi:hypothetical protein